MELYDAILQGIESQKTDSDILFDCLYPCEPSEDDLLVMAILEDYDTQS